MAAWAEGAWATGALADGSWVEDDAPSPPPDFTPGKGGGRSRRHRRYYVEIDGQEYEAESPAHAEAILERARELAQKAAERQAEAATAKALPRVRRLGKVKPVALKAPVIKTDAPIDTRSFQRELQRIYREAAQAAEMRLMLERQRMLEDEEDVISLLL